MDLRPNRQSGPSGPDANRDNEAHLAINGIRVYSGPVIMLKPGGSGSDSRLPILAMCESKSLEEVQQEAASRVDKIFTNYEVLHEILMRHEDKIRKRWSKKTRAQRLKVLLGAWPNIPSIHRPDFDAFQRKADFDRGRGKKYRDCFMWPYINREDLLTTKALPLLLNARGRHAPSHFAAADLQAMFFGVVAQVFVPIFLGGHVMILNGIKTNTRAYGRLMALKEHPDAIHWLSTQKQFHPGEGLSILEAQEGLLIGLVQCCRQLLQDIPESKLMSDEFPVLPEPQLKLESEISGFESLGIMAAEVPYRLPAKLDLQRIKSLLSAKASAAEDHVWALREDPDYFVTVLLETNDHRLEFLKDLDGKEHPMARLDCRQLLWARVIRFVVADAYLMLEIFSELSLQAEKLFSLQVKYLADICPSKDLPKEYSDTLLRLRFYLDQAVKGSLDILKTTAMGSPPLRRFFAREPQLNPDSTKFTVLSKGNCVDMNLKKAKIESELLYLLSILWDDGQGLLLTALPASVIMDELERLIQSEKHTHELLSPSVVSLIGEVSILLQCLHQLLLYQPWTRALERTGAEKENDMIADYMKWKESWDRMISTLWDSTPGLDTAIGLGEPSNGKFTYPIEKRRTSENVNALRKAESHLDIFWTVIDRAVIANSGDLSGTVLHALLSQPRTLQRTSEWIETETPLSATPPASKQNEADLHALYKPFSQLYLEIPKKKTDIVKAKIKVKTRGKGQRKPASVAEAEAVEQPSPADSQPTFAVDARALKVFRTMFFNPSTTSTPGEISWNDFLHAMTSVGFAATKLYGSAWQFEPTKLDIERNIQFHEPHPKPKLTFRIARNFGRRLNWAYGWFGGMFVLNQKSSTT
ncbi:hypothetical protein N7540_002946 [Penicillium herquei]|nr:hypothetical protein N7540_002946 [Penicillium herquei]